MFFFIDHQARRLACCGLIHVRQSYVFCSKSVFDFCGIADHALVQNLNHFSTGNEAWSETQRLYHTQRQRCLLRVLFVWPFSALDIVFVLTVDRVASCLSVQDACFVLNVFDLSGSSNAVVVRSSDLSFWQETRPKKK